MSDLNAFLETIRRDPDELTPRLAFADWLDEHGRESLAAAFRSGRALHVVELLGAPASHTRESGWRRARRFSLGPCPGDLDGADLLTLAHAFGLPMPGDRHPSREMVVSKVVFLHLSARWVSASVEVRYAKPVEVP